MTPLDPLTPGKRCWLLEKSTGSVCSIFEAEEVAVLTVLCREEEEVLTGAVEEVRLLLLSYARLERKKEARFK